jgi:hypothetical protein
MDEAENWPDFDGVLREIKNSIGAPESAVRQAMQELSIKGRRLIRDGRLVRYSPDDIQRIRDWIFAKRRG